MARFGRRLEHPDRLLHPLRRVGPKGEGGFERITWEEAIAEITRRLAEIRERWGGEAILPFHYGGSNGKLSDGLLDSLYFARLGASRLAKTICALPATVAATGMYGKMPGVAFADYPQARAIVIWGANPGASNIHLVPYLRQAKRAGAFLALVDPRRTLSERDVDLHLPVLPGQDLPLALAVIGRWERTGRIARSFLERHAVGWERLLERAGEWPLERAAKVAGVPAADIARLADELADRSPAVVRCGWGLERNRNGAQAIAAVLALPAMAGKFGVPGGGYTLSNNGAARFDAQDVVGRVPWSTREVNMTQLGRALTGGELDPPIRALFVYNANPASTVPNQNRVLAGLGREDLFTVVFEQVMTDTARWADVVLPAATFLEAHDLRVSYGSYVAGGVVPVVEPAGEARSNMQAFAALGRAMGFTDEAFTWSDEELLRRAAGALRLAGRPVDPERILAGGRETYDFPGPRPVQFGTVFPQTPDGKIHLAPEVLGADAYRWHPPAAAHPLALISPGSRRLISSSMGEYNLDVLEVTLHSADAAARGIGDGDPVRVFNDLGEVLCRARLSDRVRPGVASMPKGAWRRASANGATATALCPDHVSDVGGAACFNDARVEVERPRRRPSTSRSRGRGLPAPRRTRLGGLSSPCGSACRARRGRGRAARRPGGGRRRRR